MILGANVFVEENSHNKNTFDKIELFLTAYKIILFCSHETTERDDESMEEDVSRNDSNATATTSLEASDERSLSQSISTGSTSSNAISEVNSRSRERVTSTYFTKIIGKQRTSMQQGSSGGD